MDITNFVISGRDAALLYGDYGSYRAQLSRRLLATRRKLGLATKKGAKYAKKSPVTAQDIGDNHGQVFYYLHAVHEVLTLQSYVSLLLLTSERAWAHAMYMKSTHSAESKAITGSTRSRIISRLHKAYVTTQNLLNCLAESSTSGATEVDYLEARAYATSLAGAEQFEKQSWEACVKSYAEAWIIYSALFSGTNSDVFKELLSSTIEPSIRYGAYQMRLPRTVAIPAIARKYFSKSDEKAITYVENLDASLLRDSDTSKVKTESGDSAATSRTITWRSRKVDLENASIVVALDAVASATQQLSETLATLASATPRERATAYDGVLIASQDAVDATKHAIDELIADGVGQGDKRVQDLQITKTSISYDMISWRIGRNRVLSGPRDGALLDDTFVVKSRQGKQPKLSATTKEENTGRKLSHLRERVVLYDSTLQSLDSIKELPGVAGDSKFLGEVQAKHHYFRALKCLAIARSHALLSEPKNALAILARALEILNLALPTLASASENTHTSPPSISLTSSEADALAVLLQCELQRHRALVELSNLETAHSQQQKNGTTLPLVERLSSYPSEPVDLTSLVNYPPKLELIPVKPLFFDVAWNYIDYPGRLDVLPSVTETKFQNGLEKEAPKQGKKGWFGFGR